MESSDDPRDFGGEIAGPGGPHDTNAVIVDTTNAILLDYQHIAMTTSNGERICVLMLEGRINRNEDRAKVMFLMNEDGMSALVSELLGIAVRESAEFAQQFMGRLHERLAELP